MHVFDPESVSNKTTALRIYTTIKKKRNIKKATIKPSLKLEPPQQARRIISIDCARKILCTKISTNFPALIPFRINMPRCVPTVYECIYADTIVYAATNADVYMETSQ